MNAAHWINFQDEFVLSALYFLTSSWCKDKKNNEYGLAYFF